MATGNLRDTGQLHEIGSNYEQERKDNRSSGMATEVRIRLKYLILYLIDIQVLGVQEIKVSLVEI